MRCLYCGKELALLKRWTGGGEFCSDAHRQRYQEEYNELALNRLLQAKPPAAVPAPNNDPPVAAKEPVAVSAPVLEAQVKEAQVKAPEAPRTKPAVYEPPAPPPVRETPREAPPPVAQKVQPAAAPADLASFIVEVPGPALAELPPMSRPGLEFLAAAAAALPANRFFEPSHSSSDIYHLETAGLLPFEPSNRPSNYSANGRDRKLEVRDFVRANPVVQFVLSPVGETGLETKSDAMDILIFPQPPQAEPVLWQEPSVGFAATRTELGALARLTFPSTGFSSEEPLSDTAVALAEPPAALDLPEAPVIETAAELVPELINEPVLEPAAEPEPPAEEKKVLPQPVTTSLPLSLHVVAPGKGKPLQVFPAAANTVATQVPRSTSLPLRPVMTFGPAPQKNEAKNETKPEARSEPKKPLSAPVRPDPRLANPSKFRTAVADAPAPEPVKEPAPPVKQAAKAEAPSVAKTPVKDARQNKKPEVKPTVKIKDEPKAAPAFPAPLAAPYAGSNDLGLPKLNMESPNGFLSRLPVIAKIGIAVGLLVGVGCLIAFSSKSGGAATSSGAGTIVAGSALPAGEAGWITDWGADPGVRRTRQISILRSSQTLTDYRIEMTGQIESKAIGWVFRAQDPKNFYVTKLEIVKPGLSPTVALVRFAIVNGEEQAHAQLPLPMKVSLDTMYKIRFDAVGDHFTTYVQDQKIDDWTDSHIKTGGVGFYRERGEDATLKGGMNVVPLVVKK